jgi:hypothetical protein
MNIKPHLTPEEIGLLKSIAEGNDEQDAAREEFLQRLLSLQYIRTVDGRYFVTKWGERRSRSESRNDGR